MSRYFALLFSLGCAACFAASPDEGPVTLRIVNSGAVSFDSVIVQFPGQREAFGPLATEDSSAYRSVSIAYRYAPISAWAGNTEYRLQPIDYVGEQPLATGRYRYELMTESASIWLGLELVRE